MCLLCQGGEDGRPVAWGSVLLVKCVRAEWVAGVASEGVLTGAPALG